MSDWEFRPAKDLGMHGDARRQSVRREPDLVELVAGRLWWRAVGVWLRTVQHLRVEGRSHLPAGPPFVLVANHTSHLDALVLVAALPARLRGRVFPLAAGDTFFDSRASATFAATFLNALPVRRLHAGRHALADLRERLVSEPCGYVLFPEGTRSRDGAMQRFRPGVGMLVAGTDVPVVPCRVSGAFEAWPPGRKRPRAGRVSVRVGEARTFAHVADDRAGWQEVARTLEEAVRALPASSPAPGSRGGA